jgi:hypothetical protein
MSCIFRLQFLFLAACCYSQLSWVTALGYKLPRRPQISLWKILFYYKPIIASVSIGTSDQQLCVHSTDLAALSSVITTCPRALTLTPQSSVRTSQRTQYVSVFKGHSVMQIREIMTVCCEIHMKNVNTPRWKKCILLVLNVPVNVVNNKP